MSKAMKERLPGVLSSQIAFFLIGAYASFDRLFAGGGSRVQDPLKACLLSLGIIGLFLFWGTVVGAIEGILFRSVNAFRAGGGQLLRNSVWALAVLILIIAPAYPLMESVLEQRHALSGWTAYLSATLAGALAALIALKLLSARCAHPARLLLAVVIASALFFITAAGTSLFTLLQYRFRPIQLSFYIGIWWASLLSAGLLYLIGTLRATARGNGETRISALATTALLVISPALAACLCWLDSHIYVGLYGGAHLFLRVLAYLLLDLFALTLIITLQLASERRRAARAVFALFAALIIFSMVVAMRMDLRTASRSDISFEGSLLLPVLYIKQATVASIGKQGGTTIVPREHPTPNSRAAERAHALYTSRPETPRVFLIVLDALRADHLSCYGYSRRTSPTIDSFASESLLFKYCIAPGCRTTETFPSLFTSRDFRHLFLVHGPDYKISSDTNPMLAEVLAQNGFYTLGAGTVFPAYWGYARGFHDWIRCSDKSMLQKVEEKTPDIVEGKAFCYIHYIALHDAVGLTPSRIQEPEFQKASYGPTKEDNYDTTIRLADRELKKLLDHLRNEGLYDDSIIIIMADHGAGLGEHGYFGHSRGSFNGEVLVPLIIRAPGLEPGIISETVGLIDLFPTILDMAGIPGIEGIDGRSLVPLIASPDSRDDPHRPYFHIVHQSRTTVIKGDYKLMDPGHPRSRLYAFKTDPLEQIDLIGDMPGVAKELAEEVKRMDEASVKVDQLPPASVDPGSLRQGLLRKQYDNSRFTGAPVSEVVVTDNLLYGGDNGEDQTPDEEIAIQWDGFINIPKCAYNKAMKFTVLSPSEIEMWIDGNKIMDATGRQRMHSPKYWDGYVPLAPGFHSFRLRLSEKMNSDIEPALLYSPHGEKIPVPPDAFFHVQEEADGDPAARRTPQASACTRVTPVGTINLEK